jgi:hypothetical protein
MKKKLKQGLAQQMLLDAGLENKDLMVWRVNTPGLLREIVIYNPTLQVLAAPVNIFQGILASIAARASELNDPIMNGLMARLALYEITDPYSSDYDQETTTRLMVEGIKARKEINQKNQNEPT